MTEESVVAKVGELMEALDNIKKYSAFALYLRRFAIILGGSIITYLTIRILLGFYSLPAPASSHSVLYIAIVSLFLFIPISGFIVGVLYVRRKINAVKTGTWREELSGGFPSALKMLLDLDWNQTMDEISVGQFGYMTYGVLKAIGYWFVTWFILDRISLYIGLYSKPISLYGNFLIVVLSLLIVFLIVGNDLIRRYREIHSLDMLLWELRGLSLEFRRNQFKA